MTDFVLPDIPRLYTGIAEWLACFLFVISRKRRFSPVKTGFLSFAFLVANCGLQFVAGLLPLPFWVPGMIAAVGLMYLHIFTCCKASHWETGYLCVRSFILAEFAASLMWQGYCYYLSNFHSSIWVEICFLIPIYGVIFVASYFLEKKSKKASIHVPLMVKDFLAAAIIGATVFLISNLSFLNIDTSFDGDTGLQIFYIRTLVDLCGVVLMYAQQEQRVWVYANRELDAMQNVLTRQYQQYCQSKENIERINRTYHDLKHQIAVIREEKNPDKKMSYLDSMENGIKMFEAENKTGNNILDTVLTSKSLSCSDFGITFTCVADGKLIEFMDVMDICSIFGNALDNAIEGVMSIVDKEKRLIKTALYSQGDLIMIRVENYFENTLLFESGALATTKNEKTGHGYGLKSIRTVAEKYGGTLKIITNDNWFTLLVLIPKNKI